MIKKLIINAMVRVANMSKKVAVGYCINLTCQFLLAVGMLLTGLLFYSSDNTPSWSIYLIIAGGVFLFTTTFTIMIATISSNYVEKRLKAKKEEEETDNRENKS